MKAVACTQRNINTGVHTENIGFPKISPGTEIFLYLVLDKLGKTYECDLMLWTEFFAC